MSLGQISLRKLVHAQHHGGQNEQPAGPASPPVRTTRTAPATTTESIEPGDLSGIEQTLDLWTGTATSQFKLDATPVTVKTVVHGDADLVATQVSSALLASGGLGVAVSFGGGTPSKSGANWTAASEHASIILENASTSTSVLIRRKQDYDEYTVRVSFSAGFELLRVGPHSFVVGRALSGTVGTAKSSSSSSSGERAPVDVLSVAVSFAPANGYGIEPFLPETLNRSTAVGGWLPARWRINSGIQNSSATPVTFDAAAASSASHWKRYWTRGGMVDFANAFAVDARAKELERRVVLSLYLHGAQEAGFVFNSESGLIQNSWGTVNVHTGPPGCTIQQRKHHPLTQCGPPRDGPLLVISHTNMQSIVC